MSVSGYVVMLRQVKKLLSVGRREKHRGAVSLSGRRRLPRLPHLETLEIRSLLTGTGTPTSADISSDVRAGEELLIRRLQQNLPATVIQVIDSAGATPVRTSSTTEPLAWAPRADLVLDQHTVWGETICYPASVTAMSMQASADAPEGELLSPQSTLSAQASVVTIILKRRTSIGPNPPTNPPPTVPDSPGTTPPSVPLAGDSSGASSSDNDDPVSDPDPDTVEPGTSQPPNTTVPRVLDLPDVSNGPVPGDGQEPSDPDPTDASSGTGTPPSGSVDVPDDGVLTSGRDLLGSPGATTTTGAGDSDADAGSPASGATSSVQSTTRSLLTAVATVPASNLAASHSSAGKDAGSAATWPALVDKAIVDSSDQVWRLLRF